MEATPANGSNAFGTHMVPAGLANRFVEALTPGDSATGARSDFYTDHSQHLQESFTDQIAGAGSMAQVPTSPSGVSNCYIFKSRLQEYAQKVGLPTPLYETIKEGASHQPSFKSTVIVGGVRYDSLPGFLNRKAAEQSAAEIALMELSKCGESKESISVPVHETGLCKNLLQDYTQKMNYALPTYICKRDDTPGRALPFSCSVEIGGIRYIGAAAKTKKEAEIKAARTALLAIRSSTAVAGENLSSETQYTVVPPKRKMPDTPLPEVTEKPKKPKRSRLKKRQHNSRHPGNVGVQKQPKNMDVLATNDDMGTTVAVQLQPVENGSSDVQVPDCGQAPYCLASSVQDTNGSSNINQHNKEASAVESGSLPEVADSLEQTDGKIDPAISSAPPTEANRDPIVPDAASIVTDPPSSQQLDGSLSDSGISQGDPAPAIADTNHEKEENTPATSVAPVISHPLATQEPDASVTDGTSQGEPARSTADPDHREEISQVQI